MNESKASVSSKDPRRHSPFPPVTPKAEIYLHKLSIYLLDYYSKYVYLELSLTFHVQALLATEYLSPPPLLWRQGSPVSLGESPPPPLHLPQSKRAGQGGRRPPALQSWLDISQHCSLRQLRSHWADLSCQSQRRGQDQQVSRLSPHSWFLLSSPPSWSMNVPLVQP